MHFYELHEGDEDVFSDVLLARDDEMDPDEFFELVQSIRRRIQESYEDDTLIESIAVELEREHGFIFVSDERLTAAVNVSTDEKENFLADLDDEDMPRRRASATPTTARSSREFDPGGRSRPPELTGSPASGGARRPGRSDRQRLNRISTTSPSLTLYVLPSERSRPAFFASAIEPSVSRSS